MASRVKVEPRSSPPTSPRIKQELDSDGVPVPSPTFDLYDDDTIIISDDEDDEFDDSEDATAHNFDAQHFVKQEFPNPVPTFLPLTDEFHQDLVSSFSNAIGSPISIARPQACCNIRHGEIRFVVHSLPPGIDWSDIQAQAPEAVTNSKFMIGSWITADADVKINMARDPLAATKTENIFSGYMVGDESNIQVCLLTMKKHLCNDFLQGSDGVAKEYQDFAHILATDLRLNHHDISKALGFLANHRIRMCDLVGMITNLPSTEITTKASIESLRRILRCPELEKIMHSFNNVKDLLELENTKYYTTVQKQQQSEALVAVWFSGTKYLASVRALVPSFFMDNGQHVHVVENIAGKRFSLLLSFKDEPSADELSRSIELLRCHLDVATGSRSVTTKPQHLPNGQPLFRVSGSRCQNRSSRQMSIALRNALAENSQDYRAPNMSVSATSRMPIRWVFVLRQSTEDSVPSKTSIPRQIWAMLISSDSPFSELTIGDEISVVIELCSSNKHPIWDRKTFSDLPDDLPLVFLTSNPDRMTRRVDKVDIVLGKGRWFTRGVGDHPRDWVDVCLQKEVIKQQIMIGRHTASEIGKYGLMKHAMIRTMAAGPKSLQFQALQYVVSEAFRLHKVTEAVVVCRVSPTPGGTAEHDGVKPSLVRQQRFLEAMIPSGISIHYVKAKEVSAYSEDFLDLLEDKLIAISRKALILSTSVDRASRSAKTHEFCTKVHETAGHMFMSFLWDDGTNLPINDALYVAESRIRPELTAADQQLEEQRRSPPSKRNRPIVKPVIWVPCAVELQHDIELKLSAAENYARACGTRFQGESSTQIPDALTKPLTRMFDKAHIKQWNEFLQDCIDIPINVIYAGKHTCGCAETGHGADCVCSCKHCMSFLACPCVDLPTCVCPDICTCRCISCHRKEKVTIDCIFPACTSPAVGSYGGERLCLDHGDLYRRLLEKDRRREIFEGNVVDTIESIKLNKRKFEVIDRETCLAPGCFEAVLSTRLYGSFCSEICKKKSAGIATAVETLYVRICARMGCQNRVPRSSNYNKFCSSACLYDKEKGLQSLPPVLADGKLTYEREKRNVCARSLCNNETLDQSLCCSKVCRLQWEIEPQNFAIPVLSMLGPDEPDFRKCRLDGCINHAPLRTIYGSYCSSRCKAEGDSDEDAPPRKRPDYRKCDYPPCHSHSPLGEKYGKYCSKSCKTSDEPRKKSIMGGKTKRVTKTPGKSLPCTRISCKNTKVQGGTWGHYCSAECKMAGKNG
ncbi:hypothetical protein M438DRAFT_346349 [Aureobasidium pullulans EXF-150]|uniref:Uncharacterized protein n=1 Tax=Aureobasidium pullulans EXF-150 TaxID=1043002 RepID=A0A074Y962_AURPU|nr:uncharacterized protein M438DRAFT_346349 [Aureobasidium pullulans EXF-150]KEQ83396.1 hypothetical protein M438DRAFT_346349 [Aureobasidium pullulans EXF-150]